ncbi:MAG: molybdopterin-dependent oxidoreductase [Pseudomonadota bacterium]
MIGANIRKDLPLAGHRLRKAALAGARVMFVNPVDYEVFFPVHAKAITAPSQLAATLAGIAACYPDSGKDAAGAVRDAIAAASPDATQRAMATALQEASHATVLLGAVASAHPQYSLLKALAGVIAAHSGAVLGILPEAANSTGAWLAGVLPHRGPNGARVAVPGLDAQAMLAAPRQAYLLFNVEPAHDCHDPAQAMAAMRAAGFVVSVSPWASPALREVADVLLPIGPFTETSGTFVNAEGRWQSFRGVASPLGESRPGWKVLRVLGNQFGLDGFGQNSSEAVRDTLLGQTGTLNLDNTQPAGPVAAGQAGAAGAGLERIGDVAINSADPLVRRAASLQMTPDAGAAALVHLNARAAERHGVRDGDTVTVTQGTGSKVMDVCVDARVADGCAWIQAGTVAAAALGAAFGPVTIERV